MRIPYVCGSLVSTAAVAGLAAFAWAHTPAPSKPPTEAKPVSVESFRPLPVGYLGVPLGTVVHVTGEAFHGDWKEAEDQICLRIKTVNGKELAKPAVFYFHRAPDSVKKPALGDKFDYYVHEYGDFEGIVTIPKEYGIDDTPIAGTAFGYRGHITIHASNSERK